MGSSNEETKLKTKFKLELYYSPNLLLWSKNIIEPNLAYTYHDLALIWPTSQTIVLITESNMKIIGFDLSFMRVNVKNDVLSK